MLTAHREFIDSWILDAIHMKYGIMYTDGGSRGNPGTAASAAVLFSGTMTQIATASKFLGDATNNVAEYTAIIIGLERAHKEGITHLDVRMDSELAVRQLNGQYRVKNPALQKLFMEVHRQVAKFSKVSFSHVRREQNVEADALVNKVLDREEMR